MTEGAGPSAAVSSPGVEMIRLLRPFWPLVLLGTALGIAGGLANAWLLATLNRALHDPDLSPARVAELLLLLVANVGGTALAGGVNSRVGQALIAHLRKDISARLLAVPISTIDTHRPHRLMALLTGDIDTVSVFTFNLSGYAIAFAVTLGGFIYLLMLSPVAFAMGVSALALGTAASLAAKRSWVRDYQAVRRADDDLHEQYRAVTEGAKELRMSRARRAFVHGVLLSDAAERIESLKSHAMRLFWMAEAAGTAVFLLTLVLVIALRGPLGLGPSVITGVVLVLLSVKGPVAQLSAALPLLSQARIAFERIAALSAGLENHDTPSGAPRVAWAHEKIETIELRGIEHRFPQLENAAPFALGSVDLTLRAGEITFVVGRNGAGKTTLIKLLLGLYAPLAGSIVVNGAVVTATSRDDYRQLFTTVFSDYYLFEDILPPVDLAQVSHHLTRLGLADKVTVADSRFSTTDLSTGQRKRLALVHAFLEDRPVFVTDEWAADQDPDFRRLFYEELLPSLRARGKIIVVISHDDRYFHVADRLLRMEDGRLTSARFTFDQRSGFC